MIKKILMFFITLIVFVCTFSVMCLAIYGDNSGVGNGAITGSCA